MMQTQSSFFLLPRFQQTTFSIFYSSSQEAFHLLPFPPLTFLHIPSNILCASFVNHLCSSSATAKPPLFLSSPHIIIHFVVMRFLMLVLLVILFCHDCTSACIACVAPP
ncbi:hypothetical protein BVRB_1g002250 [Beta vulgaris subsp. vulgaris]|nr:hypothetical protein BVRB_1g002250 [Beta vulgaris subsp. vulgaris]